MSFIEKYGYWVFKSTNELGPKKKALWHVVRHFVSAKRRWFFEGVPGISGQLWYAERKLLYETVKYQKPENCFEIGTWKGGGSTLFIARALEENGKGMLHTAEISPTFHEQAKKNYRALLPELLPYVDFRFGDHRQVFPEVLGAVGRVDFLILDGPEDGEVTLDQFLFFLPFMKPGALLLVHDWLTEKASRVRPILESGADWKLRAVLVPPRSLGLALAEKIG